jgi:hypothetical protein
MAGSRTFCKVIASRVERTLRKNHPVLFRDLQQPASAVSNGIKNALARHEEREQTQAGLVPETAILPHGM